MRDSQKNGFEIIGKSMGYVLMAVLFTIILYVILKLSNRLPENWTFFNIAGITVLIIFIGETIKRLLK